MEASEEELRYVPYYSGRKTEYCHVSVKLEQLEDEDLDARYFTGIGICKTAGGKKKNYFEAETA